MAELTGIEPVPADRQSAILPIDDSSGSLPWIRTTISAFRAQRPAIGRRGNFEIVKELVAGERFERPYPDSKSRVLPLDDPASHRNLVAHDGIEPSFPVGKTGGLPLAECAIKAKAPDFVGGSEKLLADCPRYMNVPSPAPCHAKVAGVGKQSVWDLRIIACSSTSTVTSFPKFVNTQKWWELEQFDISLTVTVTSQVPSVPPPLTVPQR